MNQSSNLSPIFAHLGFYQPCEKPFFNSCGNDFCGSVYVCGLTGREKSRWLYLHKFCCIISYKIFTPRSFVPIQLLVYESTIQVAQLFK